MSTHKSPLRLVIDATSMPPNRGGVGRYLEGLFSALGKYEQVTLGIVCQARDAEEIKKLLPKATLHIAPSYIKYAVLRLMWEQLFLVKLIKNNNYSLLHSPHYTFPIFWPYSRVVTVHDATFFSHPEVHNKIKIVFFRLWTKLTWKFADVVIAPSKETFNQISHYLGSRKKENVVAYHGVNTTIFHPANEEEIALFLDKWELRDAKIIGFLGTVEPRKNVPLLIKAVDHINRGSRRSDKLTLVIAGARGWDSQVEEAIESCDSSTTIVITGYLEIEEIRAFLSSAEILVYPSKAEGFGLPVLEGMACKVPVLSTPLSAIPEIGGETIAYSLPTLENLSQELSALMADKGRRKSLSEAGFTRSQHFTWENSAASHLVAYRKAVLDDDIY